MFSALRPSTTGRSKWGQLKIGYGLLTSDTHPKNYSISGQISGGLDAFSLWSPPGYLVDHGKVTLIPPTFTASFFHSGISRWCRLCFQLWSFAQIQFFRDLFQLRITAMEYEATCWPTHVLEPEAPTAWGARGQRWRASLTWWDLLD